MSSIPTQEHNPVEIAREAFRRLATRRVAPTPDAYREVYEEVSGASQPKSAMGGQAGAEQVLAGFALHLAAQPGEFADHGRRLQQHVRERDWTGYARTLSQLADKATKRPALSELVPLPSSDESKQLRELLYRALSFAVASLLSDQPALLTEAEALGALARQAQTQPALNEVSVRLKQLCYQIELAGGDAAETQELLLRLFRLLLGNVSELLDDGSWLRGQVDAVQQLISGPLDQRALEDTMRTLKEVIFKQGQLKHSISDVKLTVKNMMVTFIDRLGSVAASTDDFHAKMTGLNEKIGKANDITELNQVLDEVLRETRHLQSEALQSRDRMLAAQKEVEEAEQRIHDLEEQLKQMSALAREDQLTGSLNRRGMEDVFERETARADRRNSPLCLALLDLDNFKRLNETYGHQAGDAALKHLVKIVKGTLRTIDAVARYGGEEFLILLPETTVEEAVATMTRVQRELTRHFFMHENEKLLITFSCGVAMRQPDENQESLIKRADMAMYSAKSTGKNRVVVAD
ncbi:MAG TPA: diguanylate cyclase [Telluria sp.]|nr:diguanylate cyclase [Telluria sp.]